MKKAVKKTESRELNLLVRDAYLQPFADAIKGRHEWAVKKINQYTNNGKSTLSDFANGYMYFGLHRTTRGWVFREWAPNATEIYLIGDFNDWKETDTYRAKRIKNSDNWELKLPKKAMKHGDLYKMSVHWRGGQGERIPAWVRRVVQDDETKIFSAQVWAPEEEYKWKKPVFRPRTSPLLIYECHVGMGQAEEKVGTYEEFRKNVLPRIIEDGYNCIQIMAVQEHPYYGSFGYHVSNFFAASSRFGTPEELKALIDDAHQNGIAVIMDIVHSHAVKNELKDLAISPAILISISIRVVDVNTQLGIHSASIMERTTSCISCCQTVNSGRRNSISMAFALTVSHQCFITVMDLVRHFADTLIITTEIRMITLFVILRLPIN